jgi:hypothetical protein
MVFHNSDGSSGAAAVKPKADAGDAGAESIVDDVGDTSARLDGESIGTKSIGDEDGMSGLYAVKLSTIMARNHPPAKSRAEARA